MGTLVTEPFYDAVPRFFGVSLDELRQLKHPTVWIDFERGLIDEAEYVSRFFTDQRPIDAEAFKRAMCDAYQIIEGMEPILAGLKARGVPMYALSNYSPWYRLIEQKLSLSRYLDWRFVSCLTGHRKPEPEAYLNAAKNLSLSPGECLFVDDRLENCHAAQKLGMPAVHCIGPDVVRDALVRHGLLG